jgi:hypothetical protein
MRNDNDDDYYTAYEDTAPEEVATAPAVPSDEQILAFVQANIDNPALIAETAAQYGVSVADLSRATGYDPNVVVSYFEQHDVPPPAYTPPAVETREPPRPPDIIEREPPPPPEIANTPPPIPEERIYEPPRPPEKPVVETPRPPEKPVVEPPRPPKEIIERPEPPPPPPPPVVEPPKPPIKEIVEPPEDVVVAPTDKKVTPPAATAVTNTDATALPTLTDYQGKQYDGAQVLALAQQIANNAGTMTGGAFQTKGQSIGFDASEANKLLGRNATASEQVLLDMARQMIQTGVTDLSQLQAKDITSSGVNVGIDPDTGQYYALIPSGDGETSVRKDLTADQVAKIKTEEIIGSGDEGSYVRRTIDDLVTGKGLFAGDKLLTQQDAIDNPIAYTIGSTYTGGGGTSYDLKFDPKTGKPVVSASGFTTSDADSIMPIIMIASNFLLPGAGSMLSSALLDAGMSELTSQIVSKAIINGVTSGIMAEASGGDFGDGFLKGSITGAISAGVAPMISTALPSDLSPAMSTALTKAGTAAITALATGKDVGTALTTQLLNSATSGGLSYLSGEMGLSTDDARLLSSVLTPVVTQLATNGTISDATLMNAVLLAGSTVLANTDSPSVSNVSTLTTGTDADKTIGGLNLLASTTGNETLNDLASTVGTGLGAVSTATGLLNKATSLTKPTSKVNTTKANLTGALTTKKPVATTNTALAKKPLTAQQVVAARPTSAPAKVNVANLTPIKKTVTTPPKKVDVSKLTPMKQVTGKG